MPSWCSWGTSLAIAGACVLLAIVGLGTTSVGKRLLVTGRFMLGWHQIAERRNPEPPEHLPGMPPRSQIVNEVLAALGMAQ